jgi:hypothetical protein
MTKRAIYDLDLMTRLIGSRNRFMNSLTDKAGITFVRYYQPTDGGEGRIYQVCGSTVAVSTCEVGHPVDIVGTKTSIQRAVSKLEKISGYKLKRA